MGGAPNASHGRDAIQELHWSIWYLSERHVVLDNGTLYNGTQAIAGFVGTSFADIASSGNTTSINATFAGTLELNEASKVTIPLLGKTVAQEASSLLAWHQTSLRPTFTADHV